MRMEPRGSGRLWIALLGLGLLGFLVWRSIEPGRLQYVTWLLLGFFALRVVIAALGSRYSRSGAAKRIDGEPSGSEGEPAGRPDELQAGGRKEG